MPKNKTPISPVVRLTQEAVERLEAETIREQVRSKRVTTKGAVLSALILETYPPTDDPFQKKQNK